MTSESGKIKNFSALARTPLRQAALDFAEVAWRAIDTRSMIRRTVSLNGDELRLAGISIPFAPPRRLFVVGVGKCSLEASLELEKILGDRITNGVVIDVHCFELPKKIRFCLGDHPLPTTNNVDATSSIIELLSETNQDDLVIFIISGGGSALLCQPENHTCLEEAELTRCLFQKGASIAELNVIRKHLSLARGGYLAKQAYPAQVVSLIFSDVPGDDLGSIASGPTIKDETTIADALKIVDHYGLEEACGFKKQFLVDTPKDEKYFERVTNLLLLTNEAPLLAMSAAAKLAGFEPTIKERALHGEAREVGERIVREISAASPGSLYLYGGETTVTVRGSGKGGRNQELAMGALLGIAPDTAILSFASDGVDNGDHAGAICDKITLEATRELGLDFQSFLDRNDSQTFFSLVGDYLDTGYTGANVSDLVIAIKSKNVR